MEIIKRKSGLRYRDMLWINGLPVKSPIFFRKSDCKQWKTMQMSKKVLSQLHGHSNFHNKIIFSEMVSKWLNAKKATGLSRSTLTKYSDFCKNHFNPEFGQKELKSITKQEVENFQIFLRQTHNAKGTNLIMTALKSIFKEAVKEDFIHKSPCEFVKKLSVDQKHPKYWTKSEINKFLMCCKNDDYYNFFVVALNTGMRKGELAALCWDRIDFQKKTITVSRTKDRFELKERNKTNRIRVLPMNTLCFETLKKIYQNRQSDTEFVFINKDTTMMNTHHLSRHLKTIQLKAGIQNIITFHNIRDTFASHFMMNGGSIYVLQKLLGHTSIIMTQVYAHLAPDYLQSAMAGFQLSEFEFMPKPVGLNNNQDLTTQIKVFENNL